jgi:hypothetical protein
MSAALSVIEYIGTDDSASVRGMIAFSGKLRPLAVQL